jgi:hypothetical protein
VEEKVLSFAELQWNQKVQKNHEEGTELKCLKLQKKLPLPKLHADIFAEVGRWLLGLRGDPS